MPGAVAAENGVFVAFLVIHSADDEVFVESGVVAVDRAPAWIGEIQASF